MKLANLLEGYTDQLTDTVINLLGMAKLNGITVISLTALQNNLKKENFDIDNESLIELLGSIPLVQEANIKEITLKPSLAMKTAKKSKDKMKASAQKQLQKAINK